MKEQGKSFFRETGEKVRNVGAVVAAIGVLVENAVLASVGLTTFIATFVGLEITKSKK